MFRLYVDEVGTASLTHVEKDKHRYLSLTGLAIDLSHVGSCLEPNMNWIKINIFKHDPDDPVIFHRTDILGRKGPFHILSDPVTCQKFDCCILRLSKSTNFTAITALIDKQALLKKTSWRNKEPYFYLMEILVEKYAQFLERKKSVGDIMPEARGNSMDQGLQVAFSEIKRKGTYFVDKNRIESVIRSNKLKFRTKKDNIAGLQLCDLFAHPSHMYVREYLKHNVNIGLFGRKMSDILVSDKYDRSSSGRILGYGIKVAS